MKLSASRFAVSVLLTATAFGQLSRQSRTKHAPEHPFEVVRKLPHDTTAFTQGLTYYGGYFYEGTGEKGRSYLRQVRVDTGEIVRQFALAPEYFGEGITILGNEVIQLTGSHRSDLYTTSKIFDHCGPSPIQEKAGV